MNTFLDPLTIKKSLWLIPCLPLAGAVINGLLRVKKRLIPGDGHLRLCEMDTHILDAFKMLNLVGSVFYVDATLDEAIAEIKGD